MSRSRVLKAEALAIAKKLGATIVKDGKHQLATVQHGGKTILTFGIRHGRKSGHGHLCGRNKDLRLNETKVVELAICTLSKEEYFQYLESIGVIAPH